MFKISVILISTFSLSAGYLGEGRARPGSWKTVPYTAQYGSRNHLEDGPGLGHGMDHSVHHGHHGQYGFVNSYGNRHPIGGHPGHGHGHGMGHGPVGGGHGMGHVGHNYGHGYGHGPEMGHGGHGHGGMSHGHRITHAHAHGDGKRPGVGHVAPYLPVPVPETTPYIAKLIPIIQFGGTLKRLFNFGGDYDGGYSHRTGESSNAWSWKTPVPVVPLWNTKGRGGWKRSSTR